MTEGVEIPVEFVGLTEAGLKLNDGLKKISGEAIAEAERYAARLLDISNASAIDRIDAERKFQSASERLLTDSERAAYAAAQEKLKTVRNFAEREKQELELKHKYELQIAARSGQDLAAIRKKQLAEIAKLEIKATRDASDRVIGETDRVAEAAESRIKKLGSTLVAAVGAYVSIGAVRQALETGIEGMALRDLEAQTRAAYQGTEALDKVLAAFGNSISREYAMKVVALGNGFNFTAEEIENIAKVAQASMPITGHAVEESLDYVMDAVTTFSQESAEQLAITLDIEKANRDYAKSIGKTAAALTAQEQRSAAVAEITAKANDRLREYPADKIVNDIQRVNASLDDQISRFKQLLATEFVNPWASFFVDGKWSFVEDAQTRAEVATDNIRKLEAALADVNRKLGDRSLSIAARFPTADQFDLAGISVGDQAKYEQANNAAVALLEVRKGLTRALDAARVAAEKLSAAEETARQKKRQDRIDEEQAEKEAEQRRLIAQESAKRALAVRQAFQAEQLNIDKAALDTARDIELEREREGETAAQRQLRLLRAKHDIEIAELDDYKNRAIREAKARHKAELLEAEAGGQDLLVLRASQAAELRAIERESVDVSAALTRQKAEYDKTLRDINAQAADEAMQALSERNQKRVKELQREIYDLTKLLRTASDLTVTERADLVGNIVGRREQLLNIDQGALLQVDSEVKADLEYATPELAALAELGNMDMSSLRDQLFDNVIDPLTFATETARDFGDAMFDAAWAAIFEGESFKKATNQFLRDVTKRSAKMALFSLAQAAFAAGTGQYDKAGEFLLAAGLFGALALASGVGAAATGGFKDPKPKDRGTDKPEGIGADRGAQQLTLNIYNTFEGLRTDRRDYEVIADLVNRFANSPGAPKLDARVIDAY